MKLLELKPGKVGVEAHACADGSMTLVINKGILEHRTNLTLDEAERFADFIKTFVGEMRGQPSAPAAER